jgi:hypothetical protein
MLCGAIWWHGRLISHYNTRGVTSNSCLAILRNKISIWHYKRSSFLLEGSSFIITIRSWHRFIWTFRHPRSYSPSLITVRSKRRVIWTLCGPKILGYPTIPQSHGSTPSWSRTLSNGITTLSLSVTARQQLKATNFCRLRHGTHVSIDVVRRD